jgi:hypothetical protein
LSNRIASLSTGAGVEITTQRVCLPRAYLLGGVTAVELTPGTFGGGTDRFGAGVTAAAGPRFSVDEFAAVGVEANVVKDLVSSDPALGRLMVTAVSVSEPRQPGCPGSAMPLEDDQIAAGPVGGVPVRPGRRCTEGQAVAGAQVVLDVAFQEA